jgi:site-specific recombinase XerD
LNNRTRWKVMCPKYVNIVFVKYSEKLIEDWKISRRISPHMERHSFATNCVYYWVSQQWTTRLMRHRDPKTTERYYHMDNKWLKSEYDKLWNSL